MTELGLSQVPSFTKSVDRAKPGKGDSDPLKDVGPPGLGDSKAMSFEKALKKKVDQPDKTEKVETGKKEDPEVSEESRKVGPQLARKIGTKKEKQMLKFMDSMQSELGVPPENFLEAMAKLSPQDLLKPPEETATQIIRNLGLATDDESKALAMYTKMLETSGSKQFFMDSQANSAQLAVGASEAAAAAVAAAQLARNGQTEAQIKKLEQAGSSLESQAKQLNLSNSMETAKPNLTAQPKATVQSEEQLMKSLDDLNRKFFVDNRQVAKAQASLESQSSGGFSVAGMSPVETSEFNFGESFGDDSIQRINAEQNQEQAQGVLAPLAGGLGLANAETSESSKVLSTQPEAGGLKKKLVEAAVDPKAVAVEAPAPSFFKATQFQSEFSKNGSEGKSQNKDEVELKAKNVGAEKTDFFVKPEATPLGANKEIALAPLPIEAQRAMPQANLENIAQAATILVGRGGGEAKIKLNPEGLGEIQLNVQVKAGRVQVEMSTETKEAKKMIEASMADLRESLGSHKLQIDKIQVDVGNQASSDSRGQEKGLDLRADINREQARQFMGQFKEDTAGRRDPFFEMPDVSNFTRRANSPEPIPAYRTNASSVRRYSGINTGGRVNIEA